MLVKSCISKSYQKVDAYSGVNEIEDFLIESNFLAVFDEGEFCGILTPVDLIKHPHKLVIDCLTEKGKLYVEDSIIHALQQLYKNHSFALPVFDGNQYIGIVEKGSIVERLTIKIEELYNKSLISQKLRTEFLNNLSHEIRTPLNGILGFLEIIASLDLECLETEGPEYINYMRVSSDKFLMVMNDLVELSRIQAGERIQVDKNSFNLEKLFGELKDLFLIKAACSDGMINLNHINPDPSLDLFVDGQKLKHIFFHLIENAIKFSGKQSPVLFGLKGISESKAVFFVTNEGPQIPEEDLLKIFDVFEKQNPSHRELAGGLGIGLAMVKNLLDALGGFIDVQTEIGKTTFEFSVPLK